MAWYTLFKRKDPRINHDLNDADRVAADEARRTKQDLAKIRAEVEATELRLRAKEAELSLEVRLAELQAKLDELQGGDTCEHGCQDNEFCAVCDGPTTGMSEDGQLLNTVLQRIWPTNTTPKAAPSGATVQTQKSISDDELKALWTQVAPMYQKIAKTLSDDELRDFMISRQPDIDADSIVRAIKIIRA